MIKEIKDLNKRFRVDVVKAPSTDAEIAELIKFSPIPVPEFYLEMSRQGSDFEILVDNEMYIRFWGAAGCLEMNSAYKIQKYFGQCLGIGDDEGGQAFILAPQIEGYPAGLYLSDFGCLNVQDSTYIAESLEDLLINGTGAERIYNWWKLK
jgi:hypothetical protein